VRVFELSSTVVAPARPQTRSRRANQVLRALPDLPPTDVLPQIPAQAVSPESTSLERVPAVDGLLLPSAAAHSLTKRVVDRLAAAVLLLLLVPLLLVIALAIRLSSTGPALYRQERVGLGGRTFTIWKFRTMALDADEHLVRLLVHHGRSNTPMFKVPDDPRITWLGRYLRLSSLDELPQLVNVLRGQMSLVGPRPQRPDEVALYTREQRERLTVRPGLTGLWQVSGRSSIGWDEAVGHDLRYVRTWNLRLDTIILWRTISVVAHGHGAS
jgi:lipopolysaccharide/colanic/teichoic acid biosynthesis glycosyltransferase